MVLAVGQMPHGQCAGGMQLEVAPTHLEHIGGASAHGRSNVVHAQHGIHAIIGYLRAALQETCNMWGSQWPGCQKGPQMAPGAGTHCSCSCTTPCFCSS